ncbi:MAG: hypothetical protein ICV83_05365, partial [Cytophagales bacterium]|nr:hypothetical protein [Cytophagales bacterium]
ELHRGSKYVRQEDGIYRVRLDFLVRYFDLPAPATPTATPPAPEPVPPGPPPGANALVALLEAQLSEKDRQLAARDAQLGQLIERNREQNNIIYALEQSKQALEARLSLPLPGRSERTEAARESPGVNYLLIGLAVLAAGVALMLLYGLLLG